MCYSRSYRYVWITVDKEILSFNWESAWSLFLPVISLHRITESWLNHRWYCLCKDVQPFGKDSCWFWFGMGVYLGKQVRVYPVSLLLSYSALWCNFTLSSGCFLHGKSVFFWLPIVNIIPRIDNTKWDLILLPFKTVRMYRMSQVCGSIKMM